MENYNFGPNVIYEAFWESDRNLKRSLQRSFEMQIWKAIAIGQFAGGNQVRSLCGSFDKGPGGITDKGPGGITWGCGSLSGPFDKGTQTQVARARGNHPGRAL